MTCSGRRRWRFRGSQTSSASSPRQAARWRSSFGGQILDRVAHDQALEALALEASADFRLGTGVASVDGHAVHLTDKTTVLGRVIVGAGGPHDPLRRARWRERSLHVAVSFVLMEGDFPD